MLKYSPSKLRQLNPAVDENSFLCLGWTLKQMYSGCQASLCSFNLHLILCVHFSSWAQSSVNPMVHFCLSSCRNLELWPQNREPLTQHKLLVVWIERQLLINLKKSNQSLGSRAFLMPLSTVTIYGFQRISLSFGSQIFINIISILSKHNYINIKIMAVWT